MKLQTVFWDYPQFLDQDYFRTFLKNNRKKEIYFWILKRFLEYGRVVDTLKIFHIEEISSNMNHLQLNEYSRKKWDRLIDVYKNQRK